MFDDLLRELKELERGVQFSVQNAPDEDGYYDRECPSSECQFHFKVYGDDWSELFKDEAVYCPYCRHEAPSDDWWTTEQLEEAERQALEYVRSRLGHALRRSARRFNQRQPRKSFLQIRMQVRGTPKSYVSVPIQQMQPLELKIACDACGARFAVIGSAFFCPACGQSSVERVFSAALEKIRAKVDAASEVRETFSRQGKRDTGEIVARSLLETALVDSIVAWQCLADQLYERTIGPSPGPSAFQRLDDGDSIWREAVGEGYENWLTPGEIAALRVYLHRRHLLQHTDGRVDERYIDKSGDTTYTVGQRIVVRDGDVLAAARIVQKLGEKVQLAVTRRTAR